MRHHDHCAVCGSHFPQNESECPDCGIQANAMPVWPWSRCSEDGVFAFQMIGLLRNIRLCFVPFMAVLIFLLGTLSSSVSWMFFGAFALVIWFFSRSIYRLIKQTQVECRAQEREVESRQARFNPARSTPVERKDLKDQSDLLRSLNWKIARNGFAKRFVDSLLVLAILALVIFSGGKNGANYSIFLSWKKDVGNLSAIKGLQEEWNNGKVARILDQLIKQHFVSGGSAFFLDLEKNSEEYDYDKVVAFLNEHRGEMGPPFEKLLADNAQNLKKEAVTSSSKKKQEDSSVKGEERGIFDGMADTIRFFALISLPFFALFLLIMLIAGIVANALQLAYAAQDEAKDEFRLALEMAIGKKSGQKQESKPGSVSASKGNEEGGERGRVYSSFIGSVFAELLASMYVKYLKR